MDGFGGLGVVDTLVYGVFCVYLFFGLWALILYPVTIVS